MINSDYQYRGDEVEGDKAILELEDDQKVLIDASDKALNDVDEIVELVKTSIVEAEDVRTGDSIARQLSTVFGELEKVLFAGKGEDSQDLKLLQEERAKIIKGIRDGIKKDRKKKPTSFLWDALFKEKKFNLDTFRTFLNLASNFSQIYGMIICWVIVYFSLWSPLRILFQTDKFIEFLNFKDSGLILLEMLIYSLLAPVTFVFLWLLSSLAIDGLDFLSRGSGLAKLRPRLLVGTFLAPLFLQILLNFPEIGGMLSMKGIVSAFEAGRNVLIGNAPEKFLFGLVVILYSFIIFDLFSELKKDIKRNFLNLKKISSVRVHHRKKVGFVFIILSVVSLMVGIACTVLIYNKHYGIFYSAGKQTKYHAIEKTVNESLTIPEAELLTCIDLKFHSEETKPALIGVKKNDNKFEAMIFPVKNDMQADSNENPFMLSLLDSNFLITCADVNRYIEIKKMFKAIDR